MKLKAKDQLHISNVKPDPIRPGEEFEIADPEGRQLLDRGLATRVKAEKKMDKSSKRESKAAEQPTNKAAPVPSNKAAAAADNK